jgi:hypothetical protein
LLEGVVLLENLQGGLGRQERLLSWFMESCRLRSRRVQSP